MFFVLIKLTQILRSAGVEVTVLQNGEQTATNDTAPTEPLLHISLDGHEARFALVQRRRAPYPREVNRTLEQQCKLRDFGLPFLWVPYVSIQLGRTLTEAGWSWADEAGNCDIRAPGLRLQRRVSSTPPKKQRKTLPTGRGSLFIMRYLLSQCGTEKETISATSLATLAGVSQPRVSQVLGQLAALGLVDRRSRTQWRPNLLDLMEAFLSEYSGPLGHRELYYSLDEPLVATLKYVRATGCTTDLPLISADVGPDLLAPHRRPSTTVLYVRHHDRSLPTGLDWVAAEGTDDANVHLCWPADETIFAFPVEATTTKGPVLLADPAQMAWDLQWLGGEDRQEAAQVLFTWQMSFPEPL
jgi:hypothetical protein